MGNEILAKSIRSVTRLFIWILSMCVAGTRSGAEGESEECRRCLVSCPKKTCLKIKFYKTISRHTTAVFVIVSGSDGRAGGNPFEAS